MLDFLHFFTTLTCKISPSMLLMLFYHVENNMCCFNNNQLNFKRVWCKEESIFVECLTTALTTESTIMQQYPMKLKAIHIKLKLNVNNTIEVLNLLIFTKNMFQKRLLWQLKLGKSSKMLEFLHFYLLFTCTILPRMLLNHVERK